MIIKFDEPLSHERYLARPYVSELDGIRAVAVLLVFLSHIKWNLFHFLGGQYGVVLFFVLSGYLITALCLREELASGSISLSAFYLRRTFRIFPLYFFMVFIYFFIIFAFHVKAEWAIIVRAYWPAYLFFYQEFVREWTDSRMPLIQSWTLGIEEKFYLVWPLLCFVLLSSWGRQSRWIVAAMGSVAFVIARPLLSSVGYSTLGRCLEPYSSLLSGSFLALILHRPTGYSAFVAIFSPGIGNVLTLAMVAVQAGVAPAERLGLGRVWLPLYTLIATAWLGALLIRDGPVQHMLRSAFFTLVGRLSYGIYLVHLLVLAPVHIVADRITDPVLRGVFAGTSGSILSALVAYILAITIERPLTRVGRRLSNRLSGKPNATLSSWVPRPPGSFPDF